MEPMFSDINAFNGPGPHNLNTPSLSTFHLTPDLTPTAGIIDHREKQLKHFGVDPIE